MKHTLLNIVAYLSLIGFPYKLSRFISILLDYIASKRFRFLSNNSGQVFMEQPFHVLGHKYIRYGSFYSRAGLRLECWDKYCDMDFHPSIVIGENVCFNYRCHIGAINKIIIGNNVLVGSNVLITDHSHGSKDYSDICVTPAKRKLHSKGPVVIEDNVWIGENVCILPNVRVGHNSIIGANSVVTKNIPPYSVVAGNPSKIIKSINNEKE